MNDRDRLEQLRGLLDRLERMPASADRDWVLGGIRARAVDVQPAMTPPPVRTLPHDEANAELAAAQISRVHATETMACRKSARVKRSRPATDRVAGSASCDRRAIPASRPSPVSRRADTGRERCRPARA